MLRNRIFLAVVTILMLQASAATASELKDVLTDDAIPGWEIRDGAAEDSWVVKDGVLTCTGKALGRDGSVADWGRAWIGTKAEYTDFIIDFEYKLSPGGNSGVFIRAPAPPADGRPSYKEGHPSYHGMEIQILDDYAEKYKNLPTSANYCGSLYLIAAPSKRVTKPAGQWNHMRVTADGDHIVVELNGEKIVDADGKSHPEILKRSRRGPVGFQNHATPLWFRNIKLADLAKDRAEHKKLSHNKTEQ